MLINRSSFARGFWGFKPMFVGIWWILDLNVKSIHYGPVLPNLNSCWGEIHLMFQGLQSDECLDGCPILIGPRLLACAREDGDVEVQWEEGIGGSRYVTKCWEFKLILKQFIWWSYTSPLYPWITVWTFQLLQNRDTVTNFIVKLRSTHALVFNLFEET